VEGLLLFVALVAIRLRWRNLYHGILSGIFFISYGIGRILVETYREPDSERILSMTRGQFYSLFMVVIGVSFIAYAMKTKRRTVLAEN
ncbi:MAG: prolipoprotein diacylglyceryl transferase family protein, partial [Verrucomicrobiota bacterium]